MFVKSILETVESGSRWKLLICLIVLANEKYTLREGREEHLFSPLWVNSIGYHCTFYFLDLKVKIPTSERRLRDDRRGAISPTNGNN